MQKTIAHILVICLLACLFAACSDNVDAPVQESHPVQVGFTLSTGGGYGSRAAHGTATDEAGTGYENYIDVVGRDFRFYIFDENNFFVDELKVLMVMPTDNSEYPSTYHLTAELNNLPPANENFKVVAIASWDNYPTNLKVEETTIEDICESSKYTYKHSSNGPFIPSKTHKIPMYGVKTHDPVEFKPNLSTDLGTINMLRAMAKVEVKLHSDVADYSLEAVKLHNFTENGMAAPHGIYDNTGGDCTATLDELHMDHNYTVNTSPLDFPIEPSGDNGWIVYIPEYKNVGYVAPSYITVTLRHGDHTKDYPIYFRNYENGKPKDGEQIDIVRNHHYQFVITKVGGSIEINYTVANWEYQEKDAEGNSPNIWAQEYVYPSYENLVPWKYVMDGNTTQQITDGFIKMKYNSSNWETVDGVSVLKAPDVIKNAFDVGFRMTAPANLHWTPAISGNDYIIRVYKWKDGTLTGLPDNTSEYVADDCWYRIQVIPNKSTKEDIAVDFGITVRLIWMGDVPLNLLINGQGDKTVWPDDGMDARIIRVVQEADETSGNGN